ncbi:MAG: hypothetical protein HYZ36_01345, partial [Pedosphaera parvula]|nr:hypothetical protein [Pedosphaera parvula]
LGKAKEDENYYLGLNVKASIAETRTAGKDEKKEDKDKLDKEFQEQIKKLKEKLQTDKGFENWLFLVSKWNVDQLLKERKDFLAEKNEPEKKAEETPASVTPFAPTPKPAAKKK